MCLSSEWLSHLFTIYSQQHSKHWFTRVSSHIANFLISALLLDILSFQQLHYQTSSHSWTVHGKISVCCQVKSKHGESSTCYRAYAWKSNLYTHNFELWHYYITLHTYLPKDLCENFIVWHPVLCVCKTLSIFFHFNKSHIIGSVCLCHSTSPGGLNLAYLWLIMSSFMDAIMTPAFHTFLQYKWFTKTFANQKVPIYGKIKMGSLVIGLFVDLFID